MRTIFALILGCIALGGVNADAAAKRSAPKANCELRLVSNAGAGEIFLSLFTRSEEECLDKSDSSVKAIYKNPRGQVVGRRGGPGPQE